MGKQARSLWTGLFLTLLLALPAAAGDVETLGRFSNGGLSAEVDTFTDKDVVVAVVAVKSGETTQTYAFDLNDWPALERLWSAARHQTGDKLVAIGVLPEVGTTEKCTIAFAAGPVIRMTIMSPITGALVFEIPPSMAADFEAKLRQAAAVITPS